MLGRGSGSVLLAVVLLAVVLLAVVLLLVQLGRCGRACSAGCAPLLSLQARLRENNRNYRLCGHARLH